MALLVAQTRVESGVHSALEVMLGGLLGALATLVVFQVFAMSRSLVEKAERPPRRRTRRTRTTSSAPSCARATAASSTGVNVENAAYPLGVCAEKTRDRRRGDGRLPARATSRRSGSPPRRAAAAGSGSHEFRDPRGQLPRATTARSRTATAAELLPDTWNLPE